MKVLRSRQLLSTKERSAYSGGQTFLFLFVPAYRDSSSYFGKYQLDQTGLYSSLDQSSQTTTQQSSTSVCDASIGGMGQILALCYNYERDAHNYGRYQFQRSSEATDHASAQRAEHSDQKNLKFHIESHFPFFFRVVSNPLPAQLLHTIPEILLISGHEGSFPVGTKGFLAYCTH